MPSKILLGAFALLLAASFTANAQAYRWIDKEGRVHYTDTPPPKDAVKAQEKQLRGNTVAGGDVSFSTQEAMKKYPVRLYTSGRCGEGCTEGRAFLIKRGVPFREIEVNDEAGVSDLKKITGQNEVEVPVLIVGKDIRKGYEPGMWNTALDIAGYPKTAIPGSKTPDPAAPPNTSQEPLGPYSPR